MAETHKDWYLDLSAEECVVLFQDWMAKNITDGKKINGHDQWLNYFKNLPIIELQRLSNEGRTSLTVEAYAALRRWMDIVQTPSRIDKIYQAGLAKPKSEQKSITELANSNDKLGVLYAIRDEIAEKLDRGTGARDTAALAKEMANIMDLISEAERRQGPSSDTKLAELMNFKPAKRTRSKGARNTSYLSRTIDEVENG